MCVEGLVFIPTRMGDTETARPRYGRGGVRQFLSKVVTATDGPKTDAAVDKHGLRQALAFAAIFATLFGLLLGFGISYSIKRPVFTYQTWSDVLFGVYNIVVKCLTWRFDTTAFASIAAATAFAYEMLAAWHFYEHSTGKKWMWFPWLQNWVASWRISQGALDNLHAYHYVRLATVATFIWLALCPELLYQADEQIALTALLKFSAMWSLIPLEYMLQSGLMHAHVTAKPNGPAASVEYYKYIVLAVIGILWCLGLLFVPWIILFTYLNSTITPAAPMVYWAFLVLFVVWDFCIPMFVLSRMWWGNAKNNFRTWNPVFTMGVHNATVLVFSAILLPLAYWANVNSTWADMANSYCIITTGQVCQ